MYNKILVSSLVVILVCSNLAFIPCINGNSNVDIVENRNVKSNNGIGRLSAQLVEFNFFLNEYKSNDCKCENNFNFLSKNNEIIQNKISIIEEINYLLLSKPSFRFSPLICAILTTILIPIFILFTWANIWVNVFNYNPIITPFAVVIYTFTLKMIIDLWSIGFEFKCWPPLPSI